jgi:hypothetical protein
LPRNQFLLNSTHLYTLHNVLLLTCSISYLLFLLWIYGTLNNITITINIIQYTCSVNSTDDGQRRPTTDRLGLTGKMRESDCPRTRSKVSSEWLQSNVNVTRPVFEIFIMAGYFADSPRMSTPSVTKRLYHDIRLLV